MWAHRQGHHYDHTLCQCHGGPAHVFHKGTVRKLGQTIKITDLCLIRRTDFISSHLSENFHFK